MVFPDCTFSVEPKIDGLSLTIRYEKDTDDTMKLTIGETRGDGLIGEDVTPCALAIKNIHPTIKMPYDFMQLRGKVYMSHADFEAYNLSQEQNGKKPAENPRNLAAGTLRLAEPSLVKERGLFIQIFNVQTASVTELTTDHCEALDILQAHGISVVSHKKCSTAQEVLSAIEAIEKARATLDYNIDGAVIKINNIKQRDAFPAGSKYTGGHIAYKYPPEEKTVIMKDIDVAVGRTGKMTYTGIVADPKTGGPVRLCGTNVARVTLHNQDYINQMKIGIGGTYKIFKSGEIIPKLNGCVTEPETIFQTPKICPVCGSELVKEPEKTDICCINTACPAQLVRTLTYFCSIATMNIIGMGESIVNALIQNGYLNNFTDIYTLYRHKDELIADKVFGKEKTTMKVLNAIEASKDNPPNQLLAGFGISCVGKNTAKDIMEHFDSLQDLMTADYHTLIQIDTIGEITALNILNYFSNHKNREMIQTLEDLGLNMKMPEKETNAAKLTGLTFVITGTLPTMGRKDATDLIEHNGGKCSGSVSKKTDYLLVGEDAGSKLDKARQLGIKIITEDDLKNML